MIFRFEEDKYDAPNLNDHAHHLFENSRIKQLAFMREPERIVWVLLYDGTLLVMSYYREKNIVAWSPMTGRFVESITVARGEDGDQLWMCVKRTISGGDKHYIEILDQTNEFMDSQVTEIPAAGVVTGLGHLEGLVVEVLADGIHIGQRTVVSGQITVPTATLSVTVGPAYTFKAVVQLFDEFVPFDGSTLGHQRTINQVKLKLYRSFGGQISDDNDTGELLGLPRFPVATTMDSAVPLFTGWVHQPGVTAQGTDPTFEIVHSTPHPFEILIAATEVTSGKD